MKKAYALVFGIIISVTLLAVPFTGAFADSDPGIFNAVFNQCFSWYTGFPFADSNGYIYGQYFPQGSKSINGVVSSASFGSYYELDNIGDYIEFGMGTDPCRDYYANLWCTEVLFLSTDLIDPSYFKFESLIGGTVKDTWYQFGVTNVTVDNRSYLKVVFMWNHDTIGNYSFRITNTGGETSFSLCPIMVRFLGNRTSSTSLSTAELLDLQTSIYTSLNVARLADIIGQVDISQVDLSTLENTTSSILAALSSVPNIIQYIDQIETNQSSILSAINSFYQYFYNFGILSYNTIPNADKKILDSSLSDIDLTTSYTSKEVYIKVPNFSYNSFYSFIIQLYTSHPEDISIDITFNLPSMPSNTSTVYTSYFRRNPNDNFYAFYIYFDTPFWSQTATHYIHIKSDYNITIYPQYYSTTQYFAYMKNTYNQSVWERIYLTLKQLLIGSNDSSVTQSIDQVNDNISEQIDDIVEFEDTYNTSLENSASQIDVSSYEIQQTHGMQFMRTYTELNFDQMQNFRIIFLTPLILALAGFFLRRKT